MKKKVGGGKIRCGYTAAKKNRSRQKKKGETPDEKLSVIKKTSWGEKKFRKKYWLKVRGP